MHKQNRYDNLKTHTVSVINPHIKYTQIYVYKLQKAPHLSSASLSIQNQQKCLAIGAKSINISTLNFPQLQILCMSEQSKATTQ